LPQQQIVADLLESAYKTKMKSKEGRTCNEAIAASMSFCSCSLTNRDFGSNTNLALLKERLNAKGFLERSFSSSQGLALFLQRKSTP